MLLQGKGNEDAATERKSEYCRVLIAHHLNRHTAASSG